MNLSDISGVQATVMGLGLHGGGIETARFLCRHGATVTVTDTRTEKELAPSLERLDGLPIRFVLGRHETADFERADFVVKNPAVPRSAPYLSAARRIETDISLFLKLCSNRLIALTGSKGKSTTASAVHHVLKELPEGSRLGGNITVSPLSFLDDLSERVPVVLELSSFQLGDLHLVDGGEGWKLLKPQVSVITNILPDHQNYYHSMQAYIADKRVIYRAQERDQFTVCCYDQREGRDFADDTGASAVLFSKSELPSSLSGGYLRGERGWFRDAGVEAEILGPSTHPATTRLNLLTAAVALLHAGVPAEILRERLPEFPGVEHRMETFVERDGLRFINDSAATIPEAALAAVESVDGPLLLITGGTDKELSFELFERIVRRAAETFLLAGTATDKIVPVLAKAGLTYHGPFDSLSACLDALFERRRDAATVLLSPGCASFGMFLNEFDRGRQFKRLVLERLDRVAEPR